MSNQTSFIETMNQERTFPGTTKIKYTLFFATVFGLIALASVMLLICKSTNGIVSIGAFFLTFVAAISAAVFPAIFLVANKRKMLTWWQTVIMMVAYLIFFYILLFV